ncbi:MAG: hypothetical protein ACSHYA_05365 [Opitutaceae bacterium]
MKKKLPIALGCLIPIVGFIALSIMGLKYLRENAPDCSSTSEVVLNAKELSQERLKLLYDQMAALRESDKAKPLGEKNYFSYLEDKPIPPEFADLGPLRVSASDYTAHIMLEGCFDSYVYLHFTGLTDYQAEKGIKEIVLSWGEHEDAGSQTLWSE